MSQPPQRDLEGDQPEIGLGFAATGWKPDEIHRVAQEDAAHQLPEHVATLASLISTEPLRDVVQFRGKTLYVAKSQRSCPQGAPTSPAITNAICLRLDRRMSGLARTMGFQYTRYADDLAFSYRSPEGAAGSRANAPIGALLRGVKTILTAEGFRVHARRPP